MKILRLLLHPVAADMRRLKLFHQNDCRRNLSSRLTFGAGMAGYSHEGAHFIHRLVPPFRPLLAHSIARPGPSAADLAFVPAVASDWHYGQRRVCIYPGFIVPSRALARLEESLIALENSRRIQHP